MFGFSSPHRPTQGAARRPRNPRFAPESLERRLAPVALFGGPMAAEFAIVDFNSPEPAPQPEPIPDGPGEPPIDFPQPGGGPILPD